MKKSDKTQTILLGAACRTINPREGLPLVGYPHSDKRLNKGVGLDVCARAVAFASPESASPQAVILTLDTICVNEHIVKRIREAATARVKGLAPESIMVAATHTHSSATVMQMRMGDKLMEPAPDYVEHVLANSADAVASAWEAREPGMLRVGLTELRLGHNRRPLDKQGHATNDWFDKEARHTGFFNPNVRILAFESAGKGTPRAVISLHACHPVTLGGGNPKVSADYPGYFARAIEEALPGCFAMHLTGAAADINPRDGLADGPEQATSFGNALARAVLGAIPYSRPISAVPIKAAIETLALPLGPDANKNYSYREHDSKDGLSLTTSIQALRVGDVAFINAPGELFGATGMAIENSSPFATTFVVGYANDCLGYLVSEASLREGAYEAQNAISLETEPRLLAASRRALEKAFA